MSSELLNRLHAGRKVMLRTHNLRIVAYKQVTETRERVGDFYEKKFNTIPYQYEIVNFWLAPGSTWTSLSQYEKDIVGAAGLSPFVRIEHCIIEELGE